MSIAREAVEKYGDVKKPEATIGTGPFTLVRYEPNVKTVFRRNPDYFRAPLPWVDGVDWLVMEDDAAGIAAYRTGQVDAGPGTFGPCARRMSMRSRRPILSSSTRTSCLYDQRCVHGLLAALREELRADAELRLR